MKNDPSLKGYLLRLARCGVSFGKIDDAWRIEHGLQHRTCREIRRALNSLTFNPQFQPVCIDGRELPPLKRKVLQRDANGQIVAADFVPRVLPSVWGVRPIQYVPYFAAS